jgi:uncharacterized protein
MKPLFLDASFIVALNATDDQWHVLAASYWPEVVSQQRQLLTTTFVLDEVATLLNSQGYHRRAVLVGTQLIEDPAGGMVHVDTDLLSRGWAYFCRHADKRYSLTDCISFVIMRERGIQQALTFDHHFSQAGFEALPGELG